jgi:hypothetical protein
MLLSPRCGRNRISSVGVQGQVSVRLLMRQCFEVDCSESLVNFELSLEIGSVP